MVVTWRPASSVKLCELIAHFEGLLRFKLHSRNNNSCNNNNNNNNNNSYNLYVDN